jgi:hypothetical protein
MSAILRETPEPVTSLRDELPGALQAVIETCLRKDPADRFQSAREVREGSERSTGQPELRIGNPFSVLQISQSAPQTYAWERSHW